MKCEHRFMRTMDWPDNGVSALCISCLLTKHVDEVSETDWQNHNYKSVSDWYKEAYELQLKMEKIKL